MSTDRIGSETATKTVLLVPREKKDLPRPDFDGSFRPDLAEELARYHVVIRDHMLRDRKVPGAVLRRDLRGDAPKAP